MAAITFLQFIWPTLPIQRFTSPFTNGHHMATPKPKKQDSLFFGSEVSRKFSVATGLNGEKEAAEPPTLTSKLLKPLQAFDNLLQGYPFALVNALWKAIAYIVLVRFSRFNYVKGFTSMSPLCGLYVGFWLTASKKEILLLVPLMSLGLFFLDATEDSVLASLLQTVIEVGESCISYHTIVKFAPDYTDYCNKRTFAILILASIVAAVSGGLTRGAYVMISQQLLYTDFVYIFVKIFFSEAIGFIQMIPLALSIAEEAKEQNMFRTRFFKFWAALLCIAGIVLLELFFNRIPHDTAILDLDLLPFVAHIFCFPLVLLSGFLIGNFGFMFASVVLSVSASVSITHNSVSDNQGVMQMFRLQFFLIVLIVSTMSFMLLQEERNESLRESMRAGDQKTSFMAFLCHELRNPLHALVNVSSLVRESLTLTHEQNELFDAIEASASYMSELINDVLDTSKFEAGKMKLEYLPVDFKKLVQVVTLPLRESLRARNVDFTCIVDNIPAIISIDPTRIKQVIVNLLSNAVKFTSNGGSITCAFSCERISNCTQDMQLKFYVKDSGIGMADNVVKNLFVPFHQAHVSTTREYGGTGLGLAICKKIVDLMGGKIIVTSVKDVGTTFSVEIPVVTDTEGKMAAIDIEHDPHAVRLGVQTSEESMVTTSSLQKVEPRTRKSEEMEMSPSVTSSVYSNDEMPSLPRIDYIFAENYSISSTPRSVRSITRRSSMSNPREAFQFMAVHNMMRSSKIHSHRGSFVFNADDAEDDDEDDCSARSSLKASKKTSGSNNSSSGASSLVPNHSRRMSLSTDMESSPAIQLTTSLQSPPDQTIRFMPPPADLGARSILIVDDSAINRKILVKFLKTLGSFMIDEAIHGLDAIEKIKANGCPYSIIFMDLSMPVMGGREATERLRKELNVTAPIVAVTGDNLPDDELAKLTEAGFSGVQPKPFTKEHIERYLRSLKS
ncbi:hypothetical protein BC830DRAFT_1078115 [Chytriomyces sp. MP71]|nr:hypothetical protein BC830DRAFT_1078115 [Chytriomyces sp. MP71]